MQPVKVGLTDKAVYKYHLKEPTIVAFSKGIFFHRLNLLIFYILVANDMVSVDLLKE